MSSPAVIDPEILDMRRPFTFAAAVAAGVSPSALRGRNFRRIFHGVYIHASVPPHPLHRVQAALLIHPDNAYASHHSAARVYRLPVPDSPDEHVTVFHKADRRRRPTIRHHLAGPGSTVTLVGGVRVSSPDQLFRELAAVLGLVDLVVLGDAMVRLKLITPQRLRELCAKGSGARAELARRAAGYVREGVDSVMETKLRMLLVLAGLPEPEINFKVYDRDGRLMLRFDLSYPELKLVIEYDGRQHRADEAQWDRDNDRDDWFRTNGWVIVKVFSRGIFKEPEKTVRRVFDALRACGSRALPRALSDEWRAYFPGRG